MRELDLETFFFFLKCCYTAPEVQLPAQGSAFAASGCPAVILFMEFIPPPPPLCFFRAKIKRFMSILLFSTEELLGMDSSDFSYGINSPVVVFFKLIFVRGKN